MDSEPMCRACLSESGDAVPIFSSAETSGVQMSLSDMMMACSSVQVMSGDGLPGLICLECLRSLLIAFEFKLKCEKTDAMLREYIENNLVPMQIGAVYNKSMSVDSSGTLVPVATATTNPPGATEIKQIVGPNDLITGIPTIAINSANTIYSNTNPYIIPMVECDVLVKEEQDTMDGKMFQKPNTDGNIMLKKMTVESQTTNLTPVSEIHHATTFSPRLISSSDLMQQNQPSQITIYSSEFRDLIRVSEEQQQTAIVMPKMETIQAVNTVAQLTTNSYATIDHSQLVQQTSSGGSTEQQTVTTNNFINTLTVPTSVTFTIKETNNTCVKKIRKTKSDNEQIENNNTNFAQNDNLQPTYMKLDANKDSSVDESAAAMTVKSPVNKKQKICHHKKKTVYSVANMTDNKCVRKKDIKNNNQQSNNSSCSTKQIELDVKNVPEISQNNDSKNLVKETIIYHSNQAFIR